MKTYYYVKFENHDLLMSIDDDLRCRYITDKDIRFPQEGEEYEFLRKHLCDDKWKRKGKILYPLYKKLGSNNEIIARIDVEDNNGRIY